MQPSSSNQPIDRQSQPTHPFCTIAESNRGQSNRGKRYQSRSYQSEDYQNSYQIDRAPVPIDPPQQFFTVLIVDDSETDRQVYQRYLAKSAIVDCAVLESACGDEGLEMCLQYQPTVVLLDYMLPDTDGVAFLEELRERLKERNTQVPAVVMLTGQGSEKVAVNAMKAGAQDYLIKGELTGDQLVQTIRQVVAQQHLQRQLSRQQNQQRLMAEVALKISHSSDLTLIMQTAVEGVRSLLDCDRTLLYQFNESMNGQVVAESVLPGWVASLGANVKDTCFQEHGAERYFAGHKTIISNVQESKLSRCHISMLEQFQVKANLVVPVLLNARETPRVPKLWGLLVAHHCRDTRDWQQDELSLLDDLAVQLAIALQQHELVKSLQTQTRDLENSNDQLLEIARLLEERNRDLDEFARVASHDLRAPLRAISNLAEWLQEDLEDQVSEENKNSLTLLRQRARRLDSFVVGLLNYARAGRESIQPQVIQPSELIAEAIEMLSPPKSFQMVVEQNIPEINTQKLLLQQVFSNLIGNAIKYHDRTDGTVHVKAEDRGDTISFSVIDDGPGIPEEHHKCIFGVFQTLASRDSVESTGIGLSIVKKLVEQQGGTISVRSALGEGSRFSFTWPKETAATTLQ